MVKQKRNRPVRIPAFMAEAADRFRLAVPAIIIIAAVAGILIAGVGALVFRSDYFCIRTVEIRSDFMDDTLASSASNELIRLYAGKNIFTTDLDSMARSLGRMFPDAKNIVVTLGLPDRVIARLIFRRPIALVGDIKYYPIDGDGFVLASVSGKSRQDLPVISGIDIKRETAGRGRRVSRNLGLAIELIKKIKASRFLSSWSGNAFDAGDARNILFYLKGGVEVRIGAEDFTNRLKVLDKTLRDARLAMDRIKYIDLRFKDVVIGPK